MFHQPCCPPPRLRLISGLFSYLVSFPISLLIHPLYWDQSDSSKYKSYHIPYSSKLLHELSPMKNTIKMHHLCPNIAHCSFLYHVELLWFVLWMYQALTMWVSCRPSPLPMSLTHPSSANASSSFDACSITVRRWTHSSLTFPVAQPCAAFSPLRTHWQSADSVFSLLQAPL